ncbi:MAG: phosphate ABC transporter permease subunit PstC [Myxococcales bacterium]|nr:phosphate ABC transporter permease subunit PstC [Myxococcales bacterium]
MALDPLSDARSAALGATLDLRAPRSLGERVAGALLATAAAVSVLTTIGIVAVLVREAAAFFAEVSPAQFLLDTEWTPLFADKHFGIWPLVAGTLLTTGIAIAVALPLGLLAAIYLSELASDRVRRWVKPALELLAGVPTVVYGYFALSVITPGLQRFVPGLAGFNALGAGVAMGIMILPIIASLSEDALYAVPANLREGAYALGATKLGTVFRVIVPAAASGIGAAAILGVARAVGETMIVAIAAGQQPRLTLDPRVPVETMTAYIAQVSLGDTPHGTLEYRTIFAVGLALFLLTLALNVLSHRLRRRLKGAAA